MIDHTDLIAIQKALLDNVYSAKDLVGHYLENIRKTKHLNAYVEVYEQEALEHAVELDFKIANRKDTLGKLFGCVISVKDLIVHKDHKVSAGSKILEGFTSQFDAHVISHLIKEDAIIIGRTNCDEFGMGSDNTNSYYGPVKNAINEDKIAGGSSGGAAVSVQTNTCLIAIGTDTGGSVRQPAAMCGVIGYKPTYGLVSRYGLVAYASSFDQVGIIGKFCGDIDKVMDVISQHDDHDATMLRDNLYPEQVVSNVASYKIAYFEETLENDSIDAEIRNSIMHKIGQLQDEGCKVEKINFDYIDFLVPCYYILTTAEASSNLSRYDGVRFGYRSDDAGSLHEMYTKTRTTGFGSEVKKRIMLGTFVLSEAYFDAYFTKAQQVRTLIKQKMNELLEEYDFIILPTSPKVAWDIGHKNVDPLEMYLADIYTVLASLCGLPAISIPLGNNKDNLPFGIQLIGHAKGDKNLLTYANKI